MSVPQMILIAAGSGFISAALVLAYSVRTTRTNGQSAQPMRLHFPDDEVVFLFDGRRLADATPAARAMLPNAGGRMDDWGEFLLGFGDRFDDLETVIDQLTPGESVSLRVNDHSAPGLTLEAERNADLIRIALTDPDQEARSELVERYTMMAMRTELATLRSIAEESPVPTWKQRADGAIIWANSAYMILAQDHGPDDRSMLWPPPDIFVRAMKHPPGPDGTARIAVPGSTDGGEIWYQLLSVPDEGGTLHFATQIDAQVKAEAALSGFVQTLTKTFAHLTIGLAIFDKRRRLVLFNPALVDLTGVPAEQLTTQPTLHSFLDALRDRQRIPEPKDYKSWRMHIARIESGAADGTYAQTWYLSTGRTYRVTGHPHPDGAVAYMFEDITSEVSLTRSFRSEIKLGQSILDNFDAAVAVFSHRGTLTMSNRAYTQLWRPDSSGSTGLDIAEALQHWQSQCADPEGWAPIRAILLDAPARQTSEADLRCPDGDILRFRLRPLAGGAFMIVFERQGGAVSAAGSRLSRVGT